MFPFLKKQRSNGLNPGWAIFGSRFRHVGLRNSRLKRDLATECPRRTSLPQSSIFLTLQVPPTGRTLCPKGGSKSKFPMNLNLREDCQRRLLIPLGAGQGGKRVKKHQISNLYLQKRTDRWSRCQATRPRWKEKARSVVLSLHGATDPKPHPL